MGIMDFFRKKAKVEYDDTKPNHEEFEEYNEEEFIADISMLELERTDWSKFAAILKANRILPNSYNKKPISVETFAGENYRPFIKLTFNSSTSDSVRDLVLFQDSACQYVNGNKTHGQNEQLNELWNKFQESIRLSCKNKTKVEGYLHKVRGKEMMAVATKMMSLENLYEKEQEFLEKYKDAEFDSISSQYYDRPPQFIPIVQDENGYDVDGEGVTPFSPKTLEFCILHLTDGCKGEQGEYLIDFENICNQIKEHSCYQSEDWDKVIECGKKMVKVKYDFYVALGR